jgi:hypothetical protein
MADSHRVPETEPSYKSRKPTCRATRGSFPIHGPPARKERLSTWLGH